MAKKDKAPKAEEKKVKKVEAPVEAKKTTKKGPTIAGPHKIVLELLTATKSKPQKEGEEDVKFFSRLANAANDLADGDYEKLEDATQEWVNSAVAAMNEKKPVTGPGVTAAVEKDEETPAEGKKGKKGKKEKAGKEKKEKKSKGPRVARAPKPRLDSDVTKLRIMAAQNQTLTAAQLYAKAQEEGLALKQPTVNTVYQHTRATIAILEHLKMIRHPKPAAE